jgi:arginase
MANIHILGVPMDLGAGRRGVDMGPSAIRLARLADTLKNLGHTINDLGNVEVAVAETVDDISGLPYANVIADACHKTYETLKALPDDAFPIVLGGDHSIAMGSVAGVVHNPKGETERTGLIWIDAHTDINTPKTSPTGNIHGMPIAHLLGDGDSRLLNIWGGGAVIRPEDIVYIGIRSVDDDERRILKELGIRVYTMKDIDKRGLGEIVEQTIMQLHHTKRVHVSFDADVLDPAVAPGVGTPVPGGLSYREAHLLMELLADAKIVTSLDLVEVNPILDIQNKTGQIMVEMTASLLGKRIL